MADNVAITPGTGATVAADSIDDVLYQRMKISLGTDGEAQDLDSGQQTKANSLPVVLPSDQTVPVSGTVTANQGDAGDDAWLVAGTDQNSVVRSLPIYDLSGAGTGPFSFKSIFVDFNGQPITTVAAGSEGERALAIALVDALGTRLGTSDEPFVVKLVDDNGAALGTQANPIYTANVAASLTQYAIETSVASTGVQVLFGQAFSSTNYAVTVFGSKAGVNVNVRLGTVGGGTKSAAGIYVYPDEDGTDVAVIAMGPA